MPTYVYKAVDKNGLIVRNRVEEGSKLVLIRKLKANGLAPISINQTIARKTQLTTKRKRNINNIQEVMKITGTTQLDAITKRKMSNMDMVKSYFAMQQKLFRPLDPTFDLVSDWRKTGCLAELVDEVRGRKRGIARHGVNCKVLFGMGAYLFDDLRDARGTFGVCRLFRQLK